MSEVSSVIVESAKRPPQPMPKSRKSQSLADPSPSYGSIPTKESFNDFYNDAPPVHSSSNGDSKRENTNSAPVAKPRRLNVRRNTESTSNTQSITTPVHSERKTPRIQSHSTIGEVITRPAELFIPPPPPLETHFEISEQNSAKILTDRGDTPVKEQLKAQSFDPRPKTRKAPAPPKPPSPQGSPKSKMDPTDIGKADLPNTPLSPKAQEIQNAKMLVQEIKHNLLFKAKSEGHSSSAEVRQRAHSDSENCQNEKCDIVMPTGKNAPVEEREESEEECTFTRL